MFILTDDQGAWAMRCAGNTDIITPNLDRLARQGIRFDNFFLRFPSVQPGAGFDPLGMYPLPARRSRLDPLRQFG